MRKIVAVSAALMLLLGACSDAPDSTSSGTTAPSAADEGDGKDQKSDAGNDKKDGAGKGSDGRGDAVGGSGDEPVSNDGGGGSGSKSENGDSGGGASAQGTSTGHPAAGRYVYSQTGFEEFCQTTSCDRSDLPPKQEVSVKVNDNTVVSEVRASHSRLMRTTYEFTDETALIKEVYTRVNYQNVQMEDTYRPDPPVEALRFPLRSGMSWSGEWKAKTSGDYSISITRKESVEVGGRTVEAFRIETETHFRGQFEGKAVGVVWIDPDTNMPVKADGTVDVKSAFGRYHSESSTQLASGPGY